jgi:hypothetical protein
MAGRAGASRVASFANGITKDRAAINATITTCSSHGQTEGQITKLKLVKRQLYGPASGSPSRRYTTPAAPKLLQSQRNTPIDIDYIFTRIEMSS